MQLGAVTYNVLKDMDVDTIIQTLEPAGFTAVELRTGHKHGVEPSLSPDDRQKVKAKFAASKVKLVSFGTTCEFHSPSAEERARQIAIGKQFIELAHDTAAWGIKVRPNGFPKELPKEKTVENIARGLRELGDYGKGFGVEIWMEVHGRETSLPESAAAIMRATKHPNVGLCWNSNETDAVNGSVRQSWDLLGQWVKSCHIDELAGGYPYRELFSLMRKSGYDRWTLMECQESKEPVRFVNYYRALWKALWCA